MTVPGASAELGLRVLLRGAMVILAGVLWILVWEANHLLFEALEVAPGINLFFFPHGIRVLLTLLFGFWGATGIAITSALTSQELWGDTPLTAFITPFVSGYCAWIALALVLPGRTPILLDRGPPGSERATTGYNPLGPARVHSPSLIALVCVSAIINSGGHIASHGMSSWLHDSGALSASSSASDPAQPAEGNLKESLAQSFAAMLCGDLLGGLVLLYGLRWMVLAFERVSRSARRS